MQFWIDIEDAAGVKVGEGPIYNATRCTVKRRLSRAGAFSFEVPATDERASLITPRREALIFGRINGVKTYLGGGVIEEIGTRIRADGIPMLQVSGNDLLRELGRISTGKVKLEGTGDVNVAALLALTGWATVRENGSPDFHARLVYESCLNAILTIAEKTGAHFRLNPGTTGQRSIEWFYTIADSGLLATMHGDPLALESNANACLITGIEALEDSNDIKTRAYVFGAGEGDSAITLVHADVWPNSATPITSDYIFEGQTYRYGAAGNYIDNLTAEAAYGLDEIALAFKDIGPLTNSDADMEAASNFLVVAAVEWLHSRRRPYKSFRLEVAGLRGTLRVGSTIRVQARRFRDGEQPIDIDENLYVVEVQEAVDEAGVKVSGLIVATYPRWPVNGDEEIVREMASTKVLSAHPQTGPNVDTIPYREHVDDDHDAALHFWLGEETTTVQSVIVRFRVDPLRSTVDAVTAPADFAVNVDVSVSGTIDISHTHPLPEHDHVTNVVNDTTPDRNLGFDIPGSFGILVYDGADAGTIELHTTYQDGGETSSGGGSETLALTGTGSGTGTVDLSNAIDIVYGIFDQTNPLTYIATDLEWQVNASGWTAIDAGDAVSGASGWYQFDITSIVSNVDTYRPTQAAHNVQFRVKAASEVGKTAQITAQIERRTSVQSISTF